MGQDRELNILVPFDSRFPWQTGGRETGMYNISRRLRGQARFTFITFRRSARHPAFQGFADLEEWADVETVRPVGRWAFMLGWRRTLWNTRRLGRRLWKVGQRGGPFDLVLCLNGGVMADHGWRVSQHLGVPLAINYRSNWTAEMCLQGIPERTRERWVALEHGNLRRADLLLANGHDTAATLQTIVAGAARVVALCNGVDTDLFRPRANGEERRWPADKVVFISNSSLRGLKGLDIPIRCLSRMSADVRRRIHLVFVGKGFWAPYRQLAEAVGVADQVEYAGELTHDRMADLLRQADVGMFPGTQGVGMQHAALECLASGLPLLAHRFADYPFLVDEGRTGYLVPIGDEAAFQAAMERVVTQCDRLAEMGRQAREKSLPYDWQRIAERFLESCREAISRRRGIVP